MPAHSRPSRGFTLLEITLSIGLVVTMLTVGVLVFNGLNNWATHQAQRSNARTLVEVVRHARFLGKTIDGNGLSFPADVTVGRANQIFAQVDGPVAVEGGSVQIIPLGFALAPSAQLPANWREVAPGVFESIPE